MQLSRLIFARGPDDRRAFELVNKTNQFNLNGRRFQPADWAAALARPGAWLAVVSYQDRFGALGKIAVAPRACDRIPTVYRHLGDELPGF